MLQFLQLFNFLQESFNIKGVPLIAKVHIMQARLLSVLEEYIMVRHEKEQERKRQRVNKCLCKHIPYRILLWTRSDIYEQLQDQKKLQDQFKAEQESLYGSKPSPSKSHSAKKVPKTGSATRKLSTCGISTGSATRKLSTCGVSMQPPKTDTAHSKSVRATKKTGNIDNLFPGKFDLTMQYVK